MSEQWRPSIDIPQEIASHPPSETDISHLRERIGALFVWQLIEGEYEKIIPPRPPSVPENFKHETNINATDMIFSFRDAEGKADFITITQGLTTNGSGEGFYEGPEDVSIDINSAPAVIKLRPEEVVVESRIPALDPPPPSSREFFSSFEDVDEAFHQEFSVAPAQSRPLTEFDLANVHLLLDRMGTPSEKGVDVKVRETHRNRITALWQKK